jgi:hypothetical protein
VLIASWPFLLVLIAIFIGNEAFKRYYARLVFTSTLLFFALFSYAIVTVPILTHSVGTVSFLLSGFAALAVFLAYLWVLARFGRDAFSASKWEIAGGTALVYALINLFWFTNVLPPLPIALAGSGVFNSVKKVGDAYVAVGEPEPWYKTLLAAPVVRVAPGKPLYVYSAVFAPVSFSMRIQHRWQHYDARRRRWLVVSTVAYPIHGGRDGGYRGYTIKRRPEPGPWRVDIATDSGRLLGRVRFDVVAAPPENPQTIRLD